MPPGAGQSALTVAEVLAGGTGDSQRMDSTGALAKIGDAVPVTVVWGSRDRIIPPAQAEAVAGGGRHLIDGAGHMPHMERPAEVQAAIEEAIAGSG